VKNLVLLLLILFCGNARAASPVSYEVGVRDFIIVDTARNRNLTTHVWYPVMLGTPAAPQNLRGPFRPVTGALNAPVARSAKTFPVVLLSHGSMGLANRLFWLAEALVRDGIIVIAVDHPGNMFGDSTADGLMRVWDRTLDLKVAFRQIAHDREFKDHLDSSKVSVVGHSAGGTTALLLAGARFSLDRFTSPIPHCRGSTDLFYKKQCDELQRINPKSYGKKLIEGDWSDTQVQSVVALDPGFAKSFQPGSLKKIKPALVFIAEKLEVPQDEIFSKDFLKLLKPGQAEVVPGSVHMSFLAPCRANVRSSEDPEVKQLCADTAGKLQIQNEVSKRTLRFLRYSWQATEQRWGGL
jgi:predicted dienelactone hydrolase